MFVLDLGIYQEMYTDEKLREHWNITDDEWNYISSRIRDIEK